MRNLVVDASVAHASSIKEPPTDEKAIVATAALKTIAETTDIVVVFDDELRREWAREGDEKGRRPSIFATRWLANLVSRGRVRELDTQSELLEPHDFIRNYGATLGISKKLEEELEEDAHLLVLARMAPAPVVSGDKEAKCGFQSYCPQHPPWQNVKWFQVGEDDQALQDWCAGSTIAPRLCP